MDHGREIGCPYCGEPTWVGVDPGGGGHQSFVSDCEVCCRPIEFRVTVEPAGDAVVEAFTEDA